MLRLSTLTMKTLKPYGDNGELERGTKLRLKKWSLALMNVWNHIKQRSPGLMQVTGTRQL